MDGWKTSFPLGRPIFRSYVSFTEGTASFLICFFARLVVKREAPTSGPSSGLGSFHLAISQDLKIFTVPPCHMEISVVQQENTAMIFC